MEEDKIIDKKNKNVRNVMNKREIEKDENISENKHYEQSD